MEPDLSKVDALANNLLHRCCIGDVLTRSAAHFPDRTALVVKEQELSYATLEGRSNAVARGLLTLNAARQEPVAFLLGNDIPLVDTFFACAKTGRIAMPINTALNSDEISYILQDSGAKVVFAEDRFVSLLEGAMADSSSVCDVVLIGEAPPDEVAGVRVTRFDDLLTQYSQSPVECIVNDRDILQCLYTSGTTSRPKGVLTSHVAVLVAILSSALQLRHQRGGQSSVQPIVLPLFHVAALNVLLLPTLLVGGTIVLFQQFEAPAVLDAIEKWRATHIVLLPAMWEELLNQPDIAKRDTDSMIFCMYVMAPMPTERIGQISKAFPNADVLLGSGQTEFTPPTVVQWPHHQHTKSASWGPAVATTEVRIAGPDGTFLSHGQEGEIVYRGPQCMAGYWNNAEANAEVFTDGWLHSGDVGHMDEEGVVWFTDRLKDIVKSGGENVSSVEVERTLLAHEEITDCAVVGTPDPRWGEAVTAVVVLAERSSLGEQDIIAYCRERLPGFKTPKRVDFVDALPRTATGKIQKHLVRTGLDPSD